MAHGSGGIYCSFDAFCVMNVRITITQRADLVAPVFVRASSLPSMPKLVLLETDAFPVYCRRTALAINRAPVLNATATHGNSLKTWNWDGTNRLKRVQLTTSCMSCIN